MSAALADCNAIDHGENLLEWFSKSGYPMSEKVLRLGQFAYHQFASSFQAASDRRCGAYGRSQDRKTAAIKCAAELVERKAMLAHYARTKEALLPKAFHTSNGWAVHFEKGEAARRAYLEALERHLLLKSFLEFGWKGFRLHQKISTPEVDLYFLLSRYATNDLVSGMVVAKSPLYKGVSFGYGIGEKSKVDFSNFWESALFESIDRILVLRGDEIDLSTDPRSWLRREVKSYLESPFDLSQLGHEELSSFDIQPPKFQTIALELGAELGMSFPFHAAFAWGGDLIPIFSKGALDASAERYLQEILSRNGLSEIPERHPVL